jgi:hypothetical protein
VRAVARRLARLEDRFVPRETEESARSRERLRRAYQRLGLRYLELGQPADYVEAVYYDCEQLPLVDRLAGRRIEKELAAVRDIEVDEVEHA